MEQRCIKQGDLLREELVTLELEIRREILDFIGFELRWMKEIGEELGLKGEELDHLSLLERAHMIVLLNCRYLYWVVNDSGWKILILLSEVQFLEYRWYLRGIYQNFGVGHKDCPDFEKKRSVNIVLK